MGVKTWTDGGSKVKTINKKRFRLVHSVRSLKMAHKREKSYESLYFVHIERKIKYHLDRNEHKVSKISKCVCGYNIYVSPRYKNLGIYCELFKEVDPRVRAFQGNVCLLCGKTEKENGRKLNNHHVFYEKKTCCWIDENGEYFTNLNAVDHSRKDYYIGGNPNYFALLCSRCHGTTNGNFLTRSKSANILRDIIDVYFEGKSYYTEEEMIELGYIKISKTEWIKP